MTLHDQHVHTKYSRDSQAEITGYMKLAHDAGCKYFVTTDHMEFMSVFNHEDWTVNYDELFIEAIPLAAEYGLTFLKGVEFGYRKDQLPRIVDTLAKIDYDIIIMSVHDNTETSEEIDYYMKEDFLRVGNHELLKFYFNNIIDALNNYEDFDVLAHFDYGFKTAYLMDKTLSIRDYEDQLITIFKLLIAKNKTLEINAKVQRTINDDNHLRYILNLYKKMGGKKLTLASDAHSCEYYLDGFDHYANIIKEVGFDHLMYFIKREEHIYNL